MRIEPDTAVIKKLQQRKFYSTGIGLEMQKNNFLRNQIDKMSEKEMRNLLHIIRLNINYLQTSAGLKGVCHICNRFQTRTGCNHACIFCKIGSVRTIKNNNISYWNFMGI